MSADLKTIGHAPNDSRCDCEREGCNHRAGACAREGWALIEVYGMKQTLCAICLRETRKALAPKE